MSKSGTSCHTSVGMTCGLDVPMVPMVHSLVAHIAIAIVIAIAIAIACVDVCPWTLPTSTEQHHSASVVASPPHRHTDTQTIHNRPA